MSDPEQNETPLSRGSCDAAHEAGHFYSPVVDTATLDPERLWPPQPEVLGMDFNDASHRQILEQAFARFLPDYDYPEHGPEDDQLDFFYTQNSQFSWLDARALFVLLRAEPPRRVIEVGSGYSSILMADVNRRFLSGRMQIQCIEPYPRPFLAEQRIPGLELMQQKVQEVDLAEFQSLAEGDLLFIDSSHVAKTGSDVNHLFFEVLPRLRPGVRVHIHDIFLPHEYPQDWVLQENRSWNEQYLLRALLMDSSRYQVEFGCSYAFWRFPDLVQRALAHPKGHAFAGGSFYFRVRRDA